MKILFLSAWFPYPHDSGSRIRIHYLLKKLASRHRVDLVTFMPDSQGEVFLPELRTWCENVEVVRRSPFWRDPRKAFTAHFSHLPRDVIACHSPEMLAAVNRISSDKNYDVVISSTTFTAPYALRLSKIPRILEEHNFQTSWMKERYHSQNSFLKKSAGWITWQKCLRYERWLYSQFQACIMVSEHDKTAVEATFPFYAGRVSIIPNGVDLIQNHPGISSPVPGTLVFNGGLGYYANLDAMRFFLADIFPRILSHHPGVKIQITGRTDSLDLSQLQLNKNVFFTGFLDDIRPTVASSWACVVPLRIGSGTRLKILEAMALGTPVISTSKGAEGLDICPGENILIADHPEEFANQVLRLLCDPDLREKLARNARVLVEEKYGWEGISESFCRLVEKIAGQGYQTPKKGNHAS